jgi:SpoVK/Ycf46/Vps4 family AAA+-type ATPase
VGFSGADIHALCKEASMIPLREISGIETIRFSEVPTAKLKHFKEALKFVRPSVNKKVLEKYEDWNEQYGSYQFNPDDLEN